METSNVNRRDALAELTGCQNCAFRDACGGLDGQRQLWGCFDRCHGCDETCDLTCPFNPRRFAFACNEVGGLDGVCGDLAGSSTHPPMYLPVLQHGGKPITELNLVWAAVPLHCLFRKSRSGRLTAKYESAIDMRRDFGLPKDANVVAIAANEEKVIEPFWSRHRADKLMRALGKLDLVAVTTPNYSFFTNAPRPHSLWNRRRTLLCAEEITANGITPLIHINATTIADWEFWARFLTERPHISVVVKEFQTGHAGTRAGSRAMDSMCRLQDRVKRPLHPVVVGGGGWVRHLSDSFGSFTIANSVPFMKAVNRQLYNDRYGAKDWRPVPSELGKPIDDYLMHNIIHYSAHLARKTTSQVRLAA
jgi:hypothetical protein